jgi:hypothetical protein
MEQMQHRPASAKAAAVVVAGRSMLLRKTKSTRQITQKQ